MVAVEHIVHDKAPVILHQIDHAKLDTELVSYGAGVGDIVHPRAVADDIVLVDPVLHVGTDDLEALGLEEQGGDTAVDAAGHRDEDAFGGHG